MYDNPVKIIRDGMKRFSILCQLQHVVVKCLPHFPLQMHNTGEYLPSKPRTDYIHFSAVFTKMVHICASADSNGHCINFENYGRNCRSYTSNISNGSYYNNESNNNLTNKGVWVNMSFT